VKLLRVENEPGTSLFWCPGCQEHHQVTRAWTVTGAEDRPTVNPSVLVMSGHYAPGQKSGGECWCTYAAKHPDDPAPFRCSRCHLFIRDGQIQFLSDCTHELAGKTVPMEDVA
jgi:hypothetical protein